MEYGSPCHKFSRRRIAGWWQSRRDIELRLRVDHGPVSKGTLRFASSHTCGLFPWFRRGTITRSHR
jgi:hypothetical protein